MNFVDSAGNRVRPFGSVEEMDEHMVQQWNSVVKPGDKVYHLGDVMFGSKDTFPSLWNRLAGIKRLTLGNHDDVFYLARGGFFKKLYESRTFGEFGLLCTHRPAHESQLIDYKRDKRMLNVHGHIHGNPSPSDQHKCVCVEQVNYTPVHIDELIALQKKLN